MRKQQAADPVYISGSVSVSKGARVFLSKHEIKAALDRHLSCDWGGVSAEEWIQNDQAYKSGGRLLSRYASKDGTLFQLITAADRSKTILTLPDESTQYISLCEMPDADASVRPSCRYTMKRAC